MSKATEDDLGDLHATVARGLKAALEAEPTAAIFGAAIAFLKNNNITADPSRNSDLAELQDKLAARRKEKKLSLTSLREAQDDFERMIGPMQ